MKKSQHKQRLLLNLLLILFIIFLFVFLFLESKFHLNKSSALPIEPSLTELAGNNANDIPSPQASQGSEASPSASSLPSQTPVPSPTPITANLISAGDCVLHAAVQQSGKVKNEDRYNFDSIFDAIKPYTEPADYSIISFESAATNNRKNYTSYPMFNCPPEMFSSFKKVGFDLVNNSNNHQLDRRLKGMLETRSNIRNAGLEVIGSYDGESPRYIIKDLNGIKVGIMAYTYGCNSMENTLTLQQQAKHLALIDEVRMKKEITELEGKADITVVAMHWGIEYSQKPSKYQEKLANSLISWGADVILGSHPHVVQPSKTVVFNNDTKYIIYSMGNFLSNQRRGATGSPKTHKELCEDSMLVSLEFLKDPVTNKTVINKVDHIPTWLWRYPIDGVHQFKIIPVPSKDFYKKGEYPKEVLDKANESFDRTMKLVTDYKR